MSGTTLPGGLPESTGPSITIWQRLQCVPRDPTSKVPLQRQLRDPMWMLGRQWQAGEFEGTDGGSPVQATYAIRERNLTQFTPAQGAATSMSPVTPVEMLVEQETPALALRYRFQLGVHFERVVAALSPAPPSVAQIISDARKQYAIASSVLNVEDTTSAQFFELVGNGAATDGVALLVDLQAFLSDATNTVPASIAALPTASLNAFVSYCGSIFATAPNSKSWVDPQLQFSFQITAQSAAGTTTLQSSDFPGGHLDWYSFTAAGGSDDLSGETPQFYTFFPTHLTFKGAPENFWWHFDDAQTDFGQLDLEKANLPGLLVSEFAVIYGNDWFVVPVPMQIASLASIDTVVVADTFGTRTLIRPTSTTTPAGATWTMFTLTGADPSADLIVLPSALGDVVDGPELEIVDFLRDDMTALAWGVERRIPGPLDAGVDAFESYLVRTNGQATPAPQLDPGTEVAYRLGTSVPDNWIPLVPMLDPSNPPMYLQRGVMTREVASPGGGTTLQTILPHGVILSPSPMIVADQAIPNAGCNVARYFRRARLADGSVIMWLARHKRAGRGPGSSGLLFDQIQAASPA